MSVCRQITDKVMDRQKLIILPKLCNCKNVPDKQWFVYYSVRDPRTGKMVRFRHYDGFADLSVKARIEHAKQLIDHYTSRLRSGWTPFADDIKTIYTDHIDYKTVAEMYGTKRSANNNIRVWISKFLEDIQPGIRHTTYITYQSKIRIFVLWLEREKIALNDISTISNQVINQFFRYLIDDRKLSKISIGKYTELLTNAFEFFRKQKLIPFNPVFDLPPCNRINDQAPRPISRIDIEAFKKEIMKDSELWLAVMFEYYCALRPGHEIREMKIKDLDLVAGTVRVTRERAKNHRERIVTIPLQLLQELRSYNLQSYNREFYVFGKGGLPGPVHIGKNKLNYKFNKIRTKLKMPREYKFYSWKHTAAVELDDNQIPLMDISRHYGHTSISITNEYMKNKKAGVSTAIRDKYSTL